MIVSNNRMYRHMSDFVTQYNENHIPTTPFQKLLLSVGSATVSLFDPQRAGNTFNFNKKITNFIIYTGFFQLYTVF